MPQQVRHRKQKTINFSAQNKVAESLSRGMVYRELALRLTSAPTVTGANNTAANTGAGDDWSVIKRLDLVVNGQEAIRSISGRALRMLNFFQFGTNPRVNKALGDGVTANPSLSSVLLLPLWMPASRRPIDTALDARLLSDLALEVTWGTHADINSAATGFTTNPKLEVFSLESFGITGPFATWRHFEIEQTIQATNQQLQIPLPVGPLYRSFLLNFTDGGVDSGAILNNLKVVSGSTTFFDAPGFVIQERQLVRASAQRVFDSVGGDYLAMQRSTKHKLEGWYYVDLVTDGMLSEAPDTLGFSEFNLELDVTVGAGTTKVLIIPNQVFPVRGQAAANGRRAA